MPVMKHIPSNSAKNLEDYLSREKEDSDLPRVMYEWGQNCRPDTAAAEFRALREEYGAQGAMRTVPSRYVTPEDPAEATHLKAGKNWRVAREGESATHLQIKPEQEQVKRAEAYHYIISFGLDEVNPDDPEQTKAAFESVAAMWEQDYAGTQAKLVAHGDARGSKVAQEKGERGKFHVHVMANAVMHSEMEVGERVFKPGMRMAGPLTHVEQMRERHDAFLDSRGHEFGLSSQKLPSVKSKEARAVRRTDQDHFERERGIQRGDGKVSDQDATRGAVWRVLAELNEEDLTGLGPNDLKLRLAERMKADGVAELKLRTTAAGEVKLRSYVVAGRKQAISGNALGGMFTDAGLNEQLELVSKGLWTPYERPQAGPPKQIPVLSADEVAVLQRSANTLARGEDTAQLRERAQRSLADAEPGSLAGAAQRSIADAAALRSITPVVEVEPLAPVEAPEQTAAVDTPETAQAPQTAQEPVDAAEVTPEVQEPVRAAAAATAETQEQPPTAPAKPKVPVKRRERAVGVLSVEQRTDVELVAVVVGERAEGGAYIDYQVAAGDRLATGRPGLHLRAKNVEVVDTQSGAKREVTRTYAQLTADQYAQLKSAAGDNQVEVGGRTVYGVAGDIVHLTRGGYTANPQTFQPSRLKPVETDVIAKQRAAEDRVRESRVNSPTRVEETFDKAIAAQQRGHDSPGLG